VPGDDHDVIIVGAGIAGGALATVLARQGARVLVLERQRRYRDHVRGELLWPWGVKEAQLLGLDFVLVDGGARVVRWTVSYDEGSERPERDDAAAVFRGVDGSVNLAHPVACGKLAGAAATAGANVRPGVRDLRLSNAGRPGVRFRDHNGDAQEATASVVVGADGRGSSVRAQASIPFEVDPPAHLIAGMLVDGVDAEHNVAARESDLLFLAFPQNAGRTRLYFNFPTGQRTRFAGGEAARRFLSASRLDCLDGEDEWSGARPAGPLATFPGADSRAPVPFADGVVLIGDAAGYENPLRGQGLAMALRDVRDVSRALLDGLPSSERLQRYAHERATRQRLANLATVVTVWANEGFGVQAPAERAARYAFIRGDEVLGPLSGSLWAGFDELPQHLTDADVSARLSAYR
jgi:2-polyprenyl-6-methoxyphenol hydroxylase-like FAD-dependent oxidoreductase